MIQTLTKLFQFARKVFEKGVDFARMHKRELEKIKELSKVVSRSANVKKIYYKNNRIVNIKVNIFLFEKFILIW